MNFESNNPQGVVEFSRPTKTSIKVGQVGQVPIFIGNFAGLKLTNFPKKGTGSVCGACPRFRTMVSKFARVRSTSTIPRNSLRFCGHLPVFTGCSSLFEFDAVRKRPAYALSPAKNQERKHQSENTKTFEQKLTKETKEFGIKHLPQAAPAVLTTTCSNTIFFTSLPSFPSLQKSSLPFRCHPVAAKSGVKVRASSSDFDHFP